MTETAFLPWLMRWRLLPDGASVRTATSRLLPVKTASGAAAMLKITADRQERTGHALMACWAGCGAAPVMAHDGEALLLARATGSASLTALARQGQDAAACRILCQTAHQLHQAACTLPLPPLEDEFCALFSAARRYGGILARCATIAAALLAAPREVVALHGDLHHGNVLDFGAAGWLAIDPKGFKGERGFDYANLFTNPDLANPTPRLAVLPAVFRQRLAIISQAADLDKTRLLMWIIAWCGLSAAWSLESRAASSVALTVAKLALAELNACPTPSAGFYD